MKQPAPGSVTFIRAAGTWRELPRAEGDEFALLGRSNVGKSSFINHVCADHGLARTAKRTGTTATANLFKVNDVTYWVDLPGYGYASTGSGERGRWSMLIRDYCQKREALCGIIWLVDIRHIGTGMDVEAFEWLRGLRKPVLPILSKGDKLSGIGRKKQAAEFSRVFPGSASRSYIQYTSMFCGRSSGKSLESGGEALPL